jgi:hypothetical protein
MQASQVAPPLVAVIAVAERAWQRAAAVLDARRPVVAVVVGPSAVATQRARPQGVVAADARRPEAAAVTVARQPKAEERYARQRVAGEDARRLKAAAVTVARQPKVEARYARQLVAAATTAAFPRSAELMVRAPLWAELVAKFAPQQEARPMADSSSLQVVSPVCRQVARLTRRPTDDS